MYEPQFVELALSEQDDALFDGDVGQYVCGGIMQYCPDPAVENVVVLALEFVEEFEGDALRAIGELRERASDPEEHVAAARYLRSVEGIEVWRLRAREVVPSVYVRTLLERLAEER